MLSTHNLHVSLDGNEILKGLDLEIGAGEVHAIMGPNGAGKSTLAKALIGHDAYEVTEGSISMQDADLLDMDPEARSRAGVFVGYQYPVEVPGVNNGEFLRLAANAARKQRGERELNADEFRPLLEAAIEAVGAPPDWQRRELNAGFSGGEKKRNELLQMFVLQPKLVILDETDSGLDIDALRVVAAGINDYRSPERGIVLITHYQRLLNLVEPDRVHVLADGRLVKSGGKELAVELEEHGYEGLMAR